MKGYVIYQIQKSRNEIILQGYYVGKTYNVNYEKFGCFDMDIKNAKVYKHKKIAENAMQQFWQFSNANPANCEVIEIEVNN